MLYSPSGRTELTGVIYLYRGRPQESETPITDNPWNTTTIQTSTLPDSWCLDCFPTFLKVCVPQHIASQLTPSIELGHFHSDRQCRHSRELGWLTEAATGSEQKGRNKVGYWKLSQAQPQGDQTQKEDTWKSFINYSEISFISRSTHSHIVKVK